MDVQAMFEEMNDHGFTDTGVERKLGMLNDALHDAADRERWPHLITSATLTFDGTSDQPTNLPANFGTIISAVDTTTKQKLEWVRSDTFDGYGLDLTQQGTPQMYYQAGDEFHVWPVPPNGYQLRLRYYRNPTEMAAEDTSDEVDWPAAHHRVLVLGALFRLYDLEDDPELAVRFQQHYEQRLATMAQRVFARADRTDIIATDPYFDGDYDF